ncbi:exopolysaccharide biosynthesis polyprenyl glycosylphosphotransferase [Mucilaginibacter sp.]
MNSKYKNPYKLFFVFTDLFALNIINLALIYYIDKHTPNYYIYTVFCIFSNIAWMVGSFSTTMYLNTELLNFKRLVIKTLSSFTAFNCLLFLFIALSSQGINLSFVFYDLSGFAIFLLFSRLLYILMITYLYRTEEHRKTIAFIGCNEHVLSLIGHLRTHNSPALIAGIFDDEKRAGFLGMPLLGGIKDCVSYAKENKITDIYATLSPKLYPILYDLAETAEKSFIRFKFVPDLSEFMNNKCYIDFIEDTAIIISLREEPLDDLSAQIMKRIFDVVISSFIVLFILSWLLPILAILIKIDSLGPVFFTQARSGKNNVPFKVIKLRTLKENPEADRLQVTRNDLRITRLGHFLRKTNLDELPQFFNVLTGDMSIVGSRPHMLKHTEEYSKIYNNYMVRHFTKPGITGWAQVNGYRGEIKKPEQLKKRIEHDIWYMENWNIWLDFKIVYLTILKTIGGDKNAF